MEMFSLQDKVALVTGGGRGIGKFIAEGMAEAGARVLLASRKEKNLNAAAAAIRDSYGTEVLPVVCDVTKDEDIARLVDTAVESFGKVDILVNNAGATWGAPTLDFPIERWDQLFDTNVRGVWLLTQKIARLMRDNGKGGSIINISSVMGFRGSEEAMHPAVAYNSTKAAINVLTLNLAVKLAPYKIRVNAIAPGFFRTDMMAYIEKPEFKQAYDLVLNTIPLRRIGDSDDIKGVALFLASEAAAYVTGHILVTDGGLLAK